MGQAVIEDGDAEALELIEVCFVNGVPVPAPAARAGAAVAAAAAAAPKPFTLDTCEKTGDVPPCVVGKALADGVARVTMLVPASGSTFQIVAERPKAKKPKPDYGVEGDAIAIRGKNLAVVDGVVVGGVDAPITSRTAKELVFTIPDGAQSGPVTLLTLTGSLTLKKPLWVGPTITKISKAGKIGGKARVKGYNLADATDVSFNGASGEIVKAKDKVLVVIVPAGATTGPITVTTPHGIVISPDDFTVK